jgi:hypothetical protein
MPRGSNPQKLAEWRARLRRFVRWQATVAEFCRSENVSVPAFYQWRRKLASAEQSPDRAVVPAPAAFLPVQVTATATLPTDMPVSSTDIQVVFPNGVRMQLPTHDAALLRLSIETVAAADVQSGGV